MSKSDLNQAILKDLKNYLNSSNKFPEILKKHIHENITDQADAARLLKEFDDSQLKKMNLEDFEKLCNVILMRRKNYNEETEDNTQHEQTEKNK